MSVFRMMASDYPFGIFKLFFLWFLFPLVTSNLWQT